MKSFFLVREMGLEPIRRRHTHLKRACLPIPALAHITRLFQTACLLYPTPRRMSSTILRILTAFFAVFLTQLAVLFPCCQPTADVPLRFVVLQYLPNLPVQ